MEVEGKKSGHLLNPADIIRSRASSFAPPPRSSLLFLAHCFLALRQLAYGRIHACLIALSASRPAVRRGLSGGTLPGESARTINPSFNFNVYSSTEWKNEVLVYDLYRTAITRHIRALPSRLSRWEMGTQASKYNSPTALLAFRQPGAFRNDRELTQPLLGRRGEYGRTLRDSSSLLPSIPSLPISFAPVFTSAARCLHSWRYDRPRIVAAPKYTRRRFKGAAPLDVPYEECDLAACSPLPRWPPPGRLYRANATPALPPLYLLFWTPWRLVVFTDTHAGRPLPSLRHSVRDLVCAEAVGSSSYRAGGRIPASCELRAGALAVDAPDEGLVHRPPAPVPPSAFCRPAGFPILPCMQIPVMSSSARRTVFLGADFAQYVHSLVCGPHQDVYSVGLTHPAAVAVEYVELSQLSYIPHSSAPCTASDSRPSLTRAASPAAFAAIHNPARPRIMILPIALSRSSSLAHSCACACPPKISALAYISHVPQPSHRPLIPPAYVVHARTSLRPSVHKGVF
ncbi:hypothetical protein B0H14DRAFT_3636751 [Mycena olivaceomarginata]|nr:hypothetical protein B0H14DRAFT_3636751 [Mycena olivaceomarginata]